MLAAILPDDRLSNRLSNLGFVLQPCFSAGMVLGSWVGNQPFPWVSTAARNPARRLPRCGHARKERVDDCEPTSDRIHYAMRKHHVRCLTEPRRWKGRELHTCSWTVVLHNVQVVNQRQEGTDTPGPILPTTAGIVQRLLLTAC